MSVQSYIELAKQEQIDLEGVGFAGKLWLQLKTVASVLAGRDETPLEQQLVQDEETFTTAVTKENAAYISVHKTDEFPYELSGIYALHVPNPLRSLLNNSSSQKKITDQLESEIDEIPVLVFVHGLGGNFQQFDFQIEEFKEVSDIVAFDLPGFGKSSDFKTSDEFTINLDNFVLFIEALLKQKGLYDRKFVLVGHSFGTKVVTRLANTLPNVKGIALLTPPNPETKINTLLFKFLYRFQFVFNVFRKLDRINNIESASIKRPFGRLDKVSDFVKLKQFRFNLFTQTQSFLSLLINWDAFDAAELIESVQKVVQNQGAVVLVDGELDKVVSKGGEKLYDLIGNSNSEFYRIEGAGHNLTLEYPQEVNSILEKFFSKADRRLQPEHKEKIIKKLSLV